MSLKLVSLISHVSTCDTVMSDHRISDKDSSFRSFDFNNTDFDSINANLMSINWHLLWDFCSPEEFPELMTLVLLQICEMCCPQKQSVAKGPQLHKSPLEKRGRSSTNSTSKTKPYYPSSKVSGS